MIGPRIILRADGNAGIGLGHVARCLALAEMLSSEFSCVFASANLSRSAVSLIAGNFEVIPLSENPRSGPDDFFVSEILKPTDIVVLDGYHFGLNLQQKIKAAGAKLVCVDDLNVQPFVADVVINHAPGTDANAYQIQEYTTLCLGLDYALLRAPFLRVAQQIAAGNSTLPRTEKHILLTFGGADKHNLCGKITSLCLAIPEVEKISVVAGAGTNMAALTEAQKTGKVQVYSGLTAAEMCRLMQHCSVLLAPASTVVLEGLATGLPVLCGYYVPEQVIPFQKLKEAGCITPLVDWNKITFSDLNIALANQFKMPVSLIDGKQPERFRDLFRSLR